MNFDNVCTKHVLRLNWYGKGVVSRQNEDADVAWARLRSKGDSGRIPPEKLEAEYSEENLPASWCNRFGDWTQGPQWSTEIRALGHKQRVNLEATGLWSSDQRPVASKFTRLEPLGLPCLVCLSQAPSETENDRRNRNEGSPAGHLGQPTSGTNRQSCQSSGATTGGSGGSRLRALARRGRLATSVKIFF